MSDKPITIDDLLFVGFNRRIAALNKHTGELIWTWKCPDGSGFVTLLVDNDTLFASVQGYTYALDPATGRPIWSNPLKGMGVGTATLATTTASSLQALLGAATEAMQQNASAAAS